MYLVRNGAGFGGRGWIRSFEGFVCASPSQNQCKRANDCCYLPLFLCQHRNDELRGNQELEDFWGIEGRKVNKIHISRGARCVIIFFFDL